MTRDLEQKDQEVFPPLTQKHKDHDVELKSDKYKTKSQEDTPTQELMTTQSYSNFARPA